MFKKLHSLAVNEDKLVDVLKLMDLFDVKPKTVRRMTDKRDWYVSMYITEKNWKKVTREISRNSKFNNESVYIV